MNYVIINESLSSLVKAQAYKHKQMETIPQIFKTTHVQAHNIYMLTTKADLYAYILVYSLHR